MELEKEYKSVVLQFYHLLPFTSEVFQLKPVFPLDMLTLQYSDLVLDIAMEDLTFKLLKENKDVYVLEQEAYSKLHARVRFNISLVFVMRGTNSPKPIFFSNIKKSMFSLHLYNL